MTQRSIANHKMKIAVTSRIKVSKYLAVTFNNGSFFLSTIGRLDTYLYHYVRAILHQTPLMAHFAYWAVFA